MKKIVVANLAVLAAVALLIACASETEEPTSEVGTVVQNLSRSSSSSSSSSTTTTSSSSSAALCGGSGQLCCTDAKTGKSYCGTATAQTACPAGETC